MSPKVALRRTLGLSAALALAVLPQASRLPPWILPSLLVLGAWKARLDLRGAAPPRRWCLLALAGAGVAGVVAGLDGPVGPDAFLALLTLLSGLKLVEARDRRDRTLLVFLVFFLVVTGFFHTQSLLAALYMGGVVVLATSVWIDLGDETGSRTMRRNLRLAGRLFGQALPLAILLFLAFPRVSGRLWSLPRESGAGVSGLSDHLAPGGISRLALSDEVAFRVTFADPLPSAAVLYWRGPVLDATDGAEWMRGNEGEERDRGAPSSNRPASGAEHGEDAVQVVTLEPSGRHWLFALDHPVSGPPGADLSRDAVLWSRRSVRARVRYAVRSRWGSLGGREVPAERRARFLRVPRASDRMLALSESWRRAAGSDSEVVGRGLRFFRDGGFTYTLTPRRLGGDPLDGFLFESRQGFCEHFAAAFAVLMRLAGVPARVVTGYLGGEYNPIGGYVVVRQADAHAWTEVWLRGEGWVRVDPTATVAPERVQFSIDNAARTTGRAVRFVLPPNGVWMRGLRRVGQLWDSLDNGWNQWVLGYGPEGQARLLSRLGLASAGLGWMLFGLVSALGLVLAAVAVHVAWQETRPRDSVQRSYRRLCRKLSSKGFPRLAHEGPLTYADRVCAERGDLAPELRAIAELYAELRYGPPTCARDAGGADLKALRARVSQLRV